MEQLPANLRDMNSISAFQRGLKSFYICRERANHYNSPVANMTHLVFVYKVFFLTVSKSLFSADSKSDFSQTHKVEPFFSKIDKFKMAA